MVCSVFQLEMTTWPCNLNYIHTSNHDDFVKRSVQWLRDVIEAVLRQHPTVAVGLVCTIVLCH